MRENRLRRLLADGQWFITGWISTGDPLICETMARAGFDAVTLDMQHGTVDEGRLLSALQAVTTTDAVPLVRVAWNDPALIMKALDLGAYGVICPMINEPDDAEALVKACRYPPQGHRSYGPTRAILYGGSDYPQEANETVLAIAMIETRTALESLDGILGVPGIDAVFIGPADLSQALGGPIGTDWTEGPVVEAVDHVVSRCRAARIPAGIFTKSISYARSMITRGFQFVAVASDLTYVSTEAARIVREINE